MKMGAKLFDPFNISALTAVPKLECRILVHTQDLPLVHRIPNLLQLKRHLVVTFLMFHSLQQIQSYRPSVVFPRAGVIVMDIPTLVSCKSGMHFPVSSIVWHACRFWWNCYSAPVGCGILWSTYLCVCMCVSVCPRAYLWNCWTDRHAILCADPLWPWLGPSPTALHYVMYFWFYGLRHVWL